MTASYRAALPDDHQFILSGWSSSYRLSRDCNIPMPIYADVQHKIIEWHLAHPATEVIIAHGEVLRGFICFRRPDLVLYLYVAQPYRRRGIGRGLFAAAGIDPRSRFRYANRTLTSFELRDKVRAAVYDSIPPRFAEEKSA